MKTYIAALLVLIATLIAHIFGTKGLYWSVPAYDVYMHILGGIGIGLAIVGFIRSNFQKLENKGVVVIIGVMVVGIIWELFEAYFNVAAAPVGTRAYYIDTVKDLIDDIVGGALVAQYVIKRGE